MPVQKKSGKLLKAPRMMTFSSRSFILFALQKRFMMRTKVPHSERKCLTVQGI